MRHFFIFSMSVLAFSQSKAVTDDIMNKYITPYKFDKRFADVPVNFEVHPKHYPSGKIFEIFNLQRIEVKTGIFHVMTINERIRLGIFKSNNSLPVQNSLKSKD